MTSSCRTTQAQPPACTRGNIRCILGLYRDNGKEDGHYYNGLYRGYIGVVLGLYRDNGEEDGHYYNGLYRGYIGVVLGLFRDNGKENGNYRDYIGIILVIETVSHTRVA